MSILLREQIKETESGIKILEAALDELRQKQGEYEQAADALSDVLGSRYTLLKALQDLLGVKDVDGVIENTLEKLEA